MSPVLPQVQLLAWTAALVALIGGGVSILGSASAVEPRPVQQVRLAIAAIRRAPTAVPEPTLASPALPTVPATAAPLALPTATPRAATPVVVWEEPFADNARGWPDDPRSTAWITQGGYQLSAFEPGQFVAVGPAANPPLGNVQVTARFHKVGGPPGGGYGIIVRAQPQTALDGSSSGGAYDELEAGDRGEVGIWRRDGDHWVDLVAWRPSAAVHPGSADNELVVRALGQQLTLIVNGVVAAQAEDATLTSGTVGVFVGGDGNQAVLQQLRVERLD